MSLGSALFTEASIARHTAKTSIASCSLISNFAVPDSTSLKLAIKVPLGVAGYAKFIAVGGSVASRLWNTKADDHSPSSDSLLAIAELTETWM